ncbi:hypothetical protein EDB81DRAFT_902763 [Dactylonectria macrodidyma]|uniref:Uncharacterized protein n=1 Tax=Dactylonectria macrodidyma TaxID=307937 RepID=A0A9P9E8W3_9HYPO|nr:hypothetical protein EDB81DRAFT_902763 [Dactylonectria macrodidyma]
MKTPPSSKPKKHSKQRDSIEFTHRPFSDFEAPSSPLAPSTDDREASAFSWVGDALTQMADTPTPKLPSNGGRLVPLRVTDQARVSQGQPAAVVATSASDVLSASHSHAQNTQGKPPNSSAIRGTGVHDDSLARSQGNYRGVSLRRGSGMVVETPNGIRKAIEREKKRRKDDNDLMSSTQVSLPASGLNDIVEEPMNPEKKETKKKKKEKEREKRKDKSKSPTKSSMSTSDRREFSEEPENSGKERKKSKRKDKDASKSPARASVTASDGHNMAEEAKNLEKEPLAKITNWDEVPHRSQRGDVPPLVVRQPITVESPSSRLPTIFERTVILKLCIGSRKDYFGLPEMSNHTEETFWAAILQRIEPTVRRKFTDYKHLRLSVSAWCEGRRKALRECALPPPRESHIDFDIAVDGWNEIWVQRFTTIHKGYFQASIWTAVETRVLSYVHNELYDWINATLQKRRDTFDTRCRDGSRKGNDNDNEYTKTFGHLHDVIKLGGRRAFEVRESEAIMSLMVKIRPSLEKIIRGHMDRKNINGEAIYEPEPELELRGDTQDTDSEIGRS